MIQEKRIVDEFLELIHIDSESKNEKAMGLCLKKKLEELGLEVWTDNAGESYGGNGFNVFGRLPGTMEGEPYLFSAHMDTVVPGNGIKPVIKDGVITSDGTTILAGDDKSGIEGILEALRVLKEDKLPHREVEVAFSVSEEIGMLGAKAADVTKLHSKKAFVMDSSGDVGRTWAGGPGQIKIFADVLGKTSHAGLAPEKGVSAIQLAAKGIAKMNLLRIDEETTCNIGTLTAEFPNNIVPDKCSLRAEVRSRNLDKLNAQAAHMIKCLQDACDEGGGKLEYKLETNYVSFKLAEDSPVIKAFLAACERIGAKPQIVMGGGGSDANIYNGKGIEATVCGTGMMLPHTKEEYITVKNLVDTARLCLDLMTH